MPIWRGTGSSDPFRSSGESTNHRFLETDRRGAVWADQDRQREEVTTPNRHNAELGGGQSVADAGTRIPRELREAPNSHYLPGACEGSSDFAAPFHPSGDGSPGAPDGGGRGSGSPAHRSARHQQGAWRPTGARVLRLRPTSRPVRGRSGGSGRMVVSRRRAERRLRSLGRSARQLTTTI